MYIQLFIQENCPYSLRAHFALEEKNVAYELTIVNNFNIDEYHDVELPQLKEREFSISDPEVILSYIEERYPSPSLMPTSVVERARIRLALRRIECDWYQLFSTIKTAQDDKVIQEAQTAIIESFLAVEPVFQEQSYFMSDELTLADCSLGALLYLLPSIGIHIDQRFGALQTYANHLFSRETFQRVLKKQGIKQRLT